MGYSDKDRAEELRRRVDNVPRFTYVVNVRTCPVCHSKDIKKIASNGKLVGVFKTTEKPRIWCNSCGYRF